MSIATVETFDPLDPAGAAELYRRLETAEPRRVPRHELDGHVGLTGRELVVSYAWVQIASHLALRAARRVRDPFAL